VKAKRFSVVNYKGGTAKTTTAVTLGHGLSRAGKRVLLIDIDPQGNASQTFGLRHDRSLYDLLTGQAEIHECIVQVRENLDIIAGNKTLVVAEQKQVSLKPP